MKPVSRLLTIAAIVAVSVVGGVTVLVAVVTSAHPGSAALSACGGLALGVGYVVWAHWLGRKRAAKRISHSAHLPDP